ncbi:PREDICTED: ankyrin repeat-containing protein At3g12360-like isoform X2 [Populus euphratica]|uniref:Ankyrin repeat-containing protein At3g12360-like isoform X2 n=1 Tax=Populus euphratica TaxID=75702 RepID=A0AAJ6SZ70_POPEU|nr:PREDICTED: ankyrin repeat-containing protein At3g12360-like isoform X2 [Populus euphratica]
MGSLPIMGIPYRAVMSGNWKSMRDHYQERVLDVPFPVTLSADTALHLAVYSKQKQPLKDLLEIVKDIQFFLPDETESLVTETESLVTETESETESLVPEIESLVPEIEFLKRKNKFGNTALHEATIYGNYEAARLLVERCPDLLKEKNNYGETPLFTAAGFAETEIVEFLITSKPEKCVDDKCRLLSIHRKRTDGLSILSAAIRGQHFETALMLLELDASLHKLKDKDGVTALQLLAQMPTAFESGFPMGICGRLIYCCLPVKRHHEVKSQVETWFKERKRDLESGQGRNSEDLGSGSERNQRAGILQYLKVPKGCWLDGFWNQKRKHVFALKVAEILIEKDESLNKVSVSITKEGLGGKEYRKGENQLSEFASKGKDTIEIQLHYTTETSETNSSLKEKIPLFIATKNGKEEIVLEIMKKYPDARKEHIPLFIATINGIEEIVWGIIDQYPHAVEHLNEEGQSILDVAVMHRQKEIFNLVKQQKVPLARLHRVIDKKCNTLLHHAADMEHYRGGTKPGPALKLQEELQWFEQVQKVIPSHYVTLRNDEGKTADELFKESHQDQLKNAQKWIKETTQSCSTVAALVATVVFAAAYTVPGGSDKNGTPNFINSPYFVVFTISDVVSLASSLTSLVVFLSLLTSPFELQEFRISLPRKLLVGFTFLFFAVITTMLSFGATILILIQSEKKLTTLLLSIAAFLPVLVFAIMQFRLYVSFMGSTCNILRITGKTLPRFLAPCLPREKKLR